MNTKRELEHIRDLHRSMEQELTNMRVQAWVYRKEFEHPQHIGKEEARKNLEIYEKRIQFLKENLQVYEQYAKLVLHSEL